VLSTVDVNAERDPLVIAEFLVRCAADSGRGVSGGIADDQSAPKRVSRFLAVCQRQATAHVGGLLAPTQHRRRHRGDDHRERQFRAPASEPAVSRTRQRTTACHV